MNFFSARLILILGLAEVPQGLVASQTNQLSQSDAWLVEGVLHANGKAYAEAIHDFGKAIEANPQNANALFNRASIYRVSGEFKLSIADLDKYILLNPTNDLAFKNRASDFGALNDFERALRDWNEGIRLNPRDPIALAMRGFCLNNLGRYEDALKDYYQAIQMDPKCASAWNNLAWLRATCPADSKRNAKEAVAAATKACECSNWKNWSRLDTLAAAYAEAGDFDQAAKIQKQALSMDQSDDPRRKAMHFRLSLYEQHQPFRQQAVSQ
jgi:tetratricopeptide (TPR) repeat protein